MNMPVAPTQVDMGTYKQLEAFPDDFLKQAAGMKDPMTGGPSLYATMAAASLDARAKLRNEQQGAHSAGQGKPPPIVSQLLQSMSPQQGPEGAPVKQGVAALLQMQKQRGDAMAQQQAQAGGRQGPVPAGVPQPHPQEETGPMPADMAGVSGLSMQRPQQMAKGGIIGFFGGEDVTLSEQEYADALRKKAIADALAAERGSPEAQKQAWRDNLMGHMNKLLGIRPQNTNQGQEERHGQYVDPAPVPDAGDEGREEMRRAQAAGTENKPAAPVNISGPRISQAVIAALPAKRTGAITPVPLSTAPATPVAPGGIQEALARKMNEQMFNKQDPSLMGTAQSVVDARKALREADNPYAGQEAAGIAMLQKRAEAQKRQADEQMQMMRANGVSFAGPGTPLQRVSGGFDRYNTGIMSQKHAAENGQLDIQQAQVDFQGKMLEAKQAYDAGNLKAAEEIVKNATTALAGVQHAALTAQGAVAGHEMGNANALTRHNTQSADNRGSNAAHIEAARIAAASKGAGAKGPMSDQTRMAIAAFKAADAALKKVDADMGDMKIRKQDYPAAKALAQKKVDAAQKLMLDVTKTDPEARLHFLENTGIDAADGGAGGAGKTRIKVDINGNTIP